MQIRVGNFEYTEVWDGVFYKKLSNYPHITDWEMRTIIIPTDEKGAIDGKIPCELRERVLYVENDCKDIWDWSEKVYRIIEKE